MPTLLRFGRILPLILVLGSLTILASCAGRPPAEPTPTFPGFDTWRYPGDEVLRTWRTASPYRWIGYYLPAPCHRDSSWVGKRPLLERLGWGVGVLYVGQQAFDGQPVTERAPGEAEPQCSRALLTTNRGRHDAWDAIAKAHAEGFERGSILYLDVERTAEVSDSLAAYVRAWQAEVLRDGRYLPGIYGHRTNAPVLFALAESVFREAGRAEKPPFWIAGGNGFSLHQPPTTAAPFANVWQGLLDVTREWGGIRLQIDENVADRPSPSAPLRPLISSVP